MYHAVYMDCMTVEELKCKLAQLFGIQSSQIGDIFMLGPSAIHIMVTDEVSPAALLPCCPKSVIFCVGYQPFGVVWSLFVDLKT